MQLKNILVAGVAASLLVACSQSGGRDGRIAKADVGVMTGAIGGALAGSTLGKGKGNVAAIAAGTLLGAYVGHEIGASLDRADMAYLKRNTQRTLESVKTGQTTTWKNPDSGNKGSLTVTNTFQSPQGQHCREFTQNITVGGKAQEGYGKACRKPDGSWEIQ